MFWSSLMKGNTLRFEVCPPHRAYPTTRPPSDGENKFILNKPLRMKLYEVYYKLTSFVEVNSSDKAAFPCTASVIRNDLLLVFSATCPARCGYLPAYHGRFPHACRHRSQYTDTYALRCSSTTTFLACSLQTHTSVNLLFFVSFTTFSLSLKTYLHTTLTSSYSSSAIVSNEN